MVDNDNYNDTGEALSVFSQCMFLDCQFKNEYDIKTKYNDLIKFLQKKLGEHCHLITKQFENKGHSLNITYDIKDDKIMEKSKVVCVELKTSVDSLDLHSNKLMFTDVESPHICEQVEICIMIA